MSDLLESVANGIVQERVMILPTKHGTFLHPQTSLEIFVQELAREWGVELPILEPMVGQALSLPVHLTLDRFNGDRYHDEILFNHRKPRLIHSGEIKVPTLFLYLEQAHRPESEDAPFIDYVKYPSRAFQQGVYDAVHRQDTRLDRLLLKLWNRPYFSTRPRIIGRDRVDGAVIQTTVHGNRQVNKWFTNYLRRNQRLITGTTSHEEEIESHVGGLYADAEPTAEFARFRSGGEQLDIKVVPGVRGLWVNVYLRDANRRINGILSEISEHDWTGVPNPDKQRKITLVGDDFGLYGGRDPRVAMMNVFDFAHRYLPNPNARPNA